MTTPRLREEKLRTLAAALAEGQSVEKAMLAAGYSPGAAKGKVVRWTGTDGSRCKGSPTKHPVVAAFLEEIRAAASEKASVTVARVLEEYARIAFGDIRALLEVTAKGVTFHPSEEWTDDEAARVAEVKQDKDGNISLKMHSKTHALDMIGKHLGMFVDRKDWTIRHIDQLTEEECREMLGPEEYERIVREAEAGDAGKSRVH